ncbi:hypothetical protein T484DRAFT_1902823 [Baffinella frigidus]|nr:hypothetical protein T484DRAFT_1902823 [Cryptophyta sp. CCMP2293]
MVDALNELAQRMGWEVTWSEKRHSGADHQPTTVVSLLLRGFEEPASEFGNRIALLVQDQWLIPKSPDFPAAVFAGIVQSCPPNATGMKEELKVVAVCAGTAIRQNCPAQCKQPRQELNDCHAEVLACRALRKYLYRELEHAQGGGSSIFQRCSPPGEAPFELKPGVLFHLYSTMLPCGDASVYLNGKQGRGLRPMEPALSLGGDGPEVPTKDICSKHWPCENVRRGKLRAKMECGRSWTPLPNNSGGDGEAANGKNKLGRLRKMSCSDKMLRWNVLGFQGKPLSLDARAFLSNIIASPLFISSVSIGDPRFNHNHLARAICCCIAKRCGHHMAPVVHHPVLHAAPWSMGDEAVEWMHLQNKDGEPSISEHSLFERFQGVLSAEQALLTEVQSREGRDLFEKAKEGGRRYAKAVREWNALLQEELGQAWLSQRKRERTQIGGRSRDQLQRCLACKEPCSPPGPP